MTLDPTDIPTHSAPPLQEAIGDGAITDVIDPKLLIRALNRLKGLVNGNGASPDDVLLIETKDVRLYRFAAETALKMVPTYGVRPEFGKNTKAELAPSEEDFHRILGNLAPDIAQTPEKRQEVVNTIFARSDKGFGIKEQRLSFHNLQRFIVRHEKCLQCKSLGHLPCITCHGTKGTRCINCQGRRQSTCPRCHGSGRVHSAKGMVACNLCHSDGRITCPKCAGRGTIRCRGCGGTGQMSCQTCGKTGWISHLAKVDMHAQIKFNFDRTNLPPLLTRQLENAPQNLVQRHDIEVALATDWVKPDKTAYNTNKTTDSPALNDTIVLHYAVMCPYGPMKFSIGGTDYSAQLFGFQAKMLECPYFLDVLTSEGQNALVAAAKTGHTKNSIEIIGRYALLRDVFEKVLLNKSLRQAHHILCNKYIAGISTERLASLTQAASKVLRYSTRIPRYAAMAGGVCSFGLFYSIITLVLLPEASGMPDIVLWGIYTLLCLAGYIAVILAAKWAVIIRQRRLFGDIISAEVLGKHAPYSRATSLGIAGGIISISLLVLAYGILSGIIHVPY